MAFKIRGYPISDDGILEVPKGTKFINVGYNGSNGMLLAVGLSDTESSSNRTSSFVFKVFNQRQDYEDDVSEFSYLGVVDEFVFLSDGRFNGRVEPRHVFYKELIQ